jgi:ATP-dependent RNA helicase DDX47/RRP3
MSKVQTSGKKSLPTKPASIQSTKPPSTQPTTPTPSPSIATTPSETSSSNEIIIEDKDDDNYGAESAQNDTEAQTFEDLGLCDELLAATEDLGWKKPSIIQSQAIPAALSGRDIIGLAETGSGKTGAFAIPVIQALLANPQSHFGLVLAPTRELAFQISETFENLGKHVGLRVVTIIGGVREFDQAKALTANPHIIVATPGRIVFHLEQTKGFSLKNLQYLVLDEADRLLNMDFEKPINQILDVIPKTRRSMLFSATMTSQVNKLQRASLVNPVKIEVSKKYQTAKNLIEKVVICPAKYKELYLTYLLTAFQGKPTIIFTATCDLSQRIAIMLRTLGFASIPLHGKLSQKHRLAALQRFKNGEKNILIATEVAARGLDIPSVDLVVNLQVPNHSKDYIHRVGRTARAGRAGTAITFVTQYDIELFQRIEKLLNYKLEQYKMDKAQVMVLAESVDKACKIAALEMKEAEQNGQGIHSQGNVGGGGSSFKKGKKH